jgi:hypothetical protein
MGERENVAKKAVEEHKINGSLRSSSPKALLKAPAMHRMLSIGNNCFTLPEQSLCREKEQNGGFGLKTALARYCRF